MSNIEQKTRPLLAFRVERDLIVLYKKFCAEHGMDQSATFKKIFEYLLNNDWAVQKITKNDTVESIKQPMIQNVEINHTWRMRCYEVGIDESLAFERVVSYMTRPGNLPAIRVIIQDGS